MAELSTRSPLGSSRTEALPRQDYSGSRPSALEAVTRDGSSENDQSCSTTCLQAWQMTQ
jgi:hypothetical protein